MITLRPFTTTDYAAWLPGALADLAREKVASGQWQADEAPQRAAADHAALLPDGLATAGHHFWALIDGAGQQVGMLWVAQQLRFGQPVAYVYNIQIDTAHQRQGHARSALLALQAECRHRGWQGVALHVFGHNAGARALYAGLGFEPTNLNLFQALHDGVPGEGGAKDNAHHAQAFTLAQAQADIRAGYLLGAPGAAVSGTVWLLSGWLGSQVALGQAVLALLVGGALIHPASVLLAKACGARGGHTPGNRLGRLAGEVTIWMLLGITMALALYTLQPQWFYPAMLAVIGGRYLSFQTLYGLRSYWMLGAALALVGVATLLLRAPPAVAALAGGALEWAFAVWLWRCAGACNGKAWTADADACARVAVGGAER